MSRTTSGHPTRALVRRASSTDGGLPSSTVISIGGGFVAFAVTVLTLLTIARVIRLAREARRERSSGQGTTFRQLWNREGGFWGFITGLGGESAAGGAGFVDLGRHRRWEEMLLRERWMLARMNEEEGDVGEIPRMSEVGVREKGAMLEESDFQPLAVTTSIRPDSSPNPTTDSSTPTDPTLNLSLLILFPSPFDETTEDYAELPELVIGTTTVIPILRHTEPPAPIEGKSTEDYEKDVIETDVAHLEYAAPVVSELRRATWKKTDSGWVVEGFEAI